MVLILRLYLHESDHHNNSFLDHLYCVSLAPNHSMKNTVHILHRPKFTPVGQSNTAVLWIVKAFACSYDTARRCKALLYQKTKKKQHFLTCNNEKISGQRPETWTPWHFPPWENQFGNVSGEKPEESSTCSSTLGLSVGQETLTL